MDGLTDGRMDGWMIDQTDISLQMGVVRISEGSWGQRQLGVAEASKPTRRFSMWFCNTKYLVF